MISQEIKFLLTHSSIYGLGTIVARLVGFLLLPLYTRYLSPANYGVLETISVSTAIIGIVVTIGIARALGRFYYVSDDQTDRDRVLMTTYVTYITGALLFLPVLLFISTPLANLLFQTEAYGYFFKISFISLLLGALIDIGLMYLRLIKKPVIFISITITRLILLIGFNVFFIVYLKMGMLGILYSTLIVRSLAAVILTAAIWRRAQFSFSFAICKDILRYLLPIIPSRIGSSMVKQSDKYFVLIFMSIADMGIYSLALKFGNIIHQLLTAPFNLAYIPRRFEIMNRSEAGEIYAGIFTYYIFLVVFAGLVISIFIPEILTLMVTPRFMKAKDIIPLVVLSMVLFGTHFHFEFGILYSKKTEYLAYINVICAMLQVTLNILLIPNYGLYGAVWSSIIVLSIEAFALYVFSKRFFTIPYQFGRVLTYCGLAAGFYAGSTFIEAGSWWIDCLLKLLLLTVFPLMVIIFRIITPQEKEKLIHIIGSKIRPSSFKRPSIKST